MQRLSKKQTSLIDRLSIRRLIISFVLLFIIMAASTVIFMDINFTGADQTAEQQTVPALEENFERFAYGLVSAEALELGGEAVPYMAMLDVTGSGEDSYTVLF